MVAESQIVKFQQVLSRFGDAVSYRDAHPEPALILEPFGESSAKSIDTPSQPNPAFAQTATDVVLAPGAYAAASSELVHPDARVVWLVKSDRNPFAGLVTLGRARNNDIVLPHPSISKMHAIFHQSPEGWLIEDRKSTNGTFLDGVRLVPERRRPLSEGTTLRLGDAILARFFEAETFFAFCELIRGQG